MSGLPFERRKGAIYTRARGDSLVQLLSGDTILTIEPAARYARDASSTTSARSARPRPRHGCPRHGSRARSRGSSSGRPAASSVSARTAPPRALKIEPFEVGQRLRLRAALRPYRYASC